jgi:multidrug efflux system membrane fusion protein
MSQQLNEKPPLSSHAAPDIRPKTASTGTPVRKRHRWTWIVVGTLILIIMVAWAYRSHTASSARARSRNGMNAPLPVVVKAAEKGDLNIYLNALGAVTPLETVTLRTQISGQLIEVKFKEGQTVNQGDVLAVIDPRPYEVALEQAQGQFEQAQAQLNDAQIDLTRYQTLAAQDSIASQQVDAQRTLVSQYEGMVKTDQAAIDSAKLNLTYCHITAPSAGRVGLRQVDQGNYVTPGDANGLVVLTQVKPMSVVFTLPEDNVPQVAARLHSGATLTVEAFDRTGTTKLASGTLDTIDNQVDPTTGTFKLRALFPNDDESLFPNQFVNIRLLVDVDHDATVIPTSAIEQGQQGALVYVIQSDNTATARTVTLGTTEGEQVAITSGLNVGERVVVDGADKLSEGMKVIVQAGRNGGGKGKSGARHKHAGADQGKSEASGGE